MIKDDSIRPTQPYMVLDADNFEQEIYLKQGISHFYSCEIKGGSDLRTVPTGCIDIIFLYIKDTGKMEAYALGTDLLFTQKHEPRDVILFGVRFMPGFHPSFLKFAMVELVGKQIELNKENFNSSLIEKMSKAKTFFDRVKLFLKEYTKAEEQIELPYGKRELLSVVKDAAYKTQGKVSIASLQEATGYTTRYINKVFIEEMGFSPKTFCKIIQFQHAIEFLNYGSLAWSYGKMDDDLPTKMTDIATYLGYYDQPQFIRDFKKYAGITPKKYLNLVSNGNYRGRIKSSDLYNRM